MSSIGTQFKWAKANNRNSDDQYLCVSFSQDGELIATITKNSQFIMIFNSLDGTLRTSRKYTGSNQAQSELIKSVIISSGTSPKAYVVAKNNPSTCAGNQVFSYDPLTFSVTARWAKKTSSTDCNHLGITFGSTEAIIYAYSYHSSTLKVSRIDDSGATPNIQWTYGFTGSASQTLISHKTIDITKDMLAITGVQSKNTCFGILVIPTTSPFIPTSSNIYDSPDLSTQSVQGLYIASENSIKVLLFSAPLTYLATLNLAGASSSYSLIETLPKMPSNFQTLGVFSRDGSTYYVASKGSKFNTNLSTATQSLGSQIETVIYSSDVKSAAYILSTSTPTTKKITVTADGVTSKTNPYIDHTAVFAFTQDTNAGMVMVNLVPSKTYVPTWPTQQSFSINAIAQPTSILTFQTGSAKTITLPLFAATKNCDDTGILSLTYSGLKADGKAYILSKDHIEVSSATGTVTIDTNLNSGKHTLLIKGELQNGAVAWQVFTLISNSPPLFSPALADQVVNLQSTIQYILPALTDVDSGQTLTISTLTITPGKFLTYDLATKTITFAPTLPGDVATHIVSVTVSDELEKPTYQFKVIVNSAPTSLYSPANFSAGLAPQTVSIGQTAQYSLPPVFNPATSDSSGVTVFYTTTKPFVTFSSTPFPGILTINPQLNDFYNLGVATIGITLQASQGSKEYTMTVNVINSAPVFSTSPLPSTTLYLGETQMLTLPTITDAEGHTVSITNQIPKAFITFDNAQTFTFSPIITTDIGTTTVIVQLSDGNMQTPYQFSVIVMSKPTFASKISFTSLTVPLNSSKSFPVPSFSDADGDAVSISIAEGSGGTLASWIQLITKNTSYLVQASPIAFSDVGITENLKLVLTTTHEAVSFPFTITVTNSPPHFTTFPPANINVAFNSFYTIDLTGYYTDDEGHTITLKSYFTPSGGTKTVIPSGIFNTPSAQLIQIFPTQLGDQGTYLIEYVISDGQPLSSTAQTTVNIINSPPIFTAEAPVSMTILMNQVYDYTLPPYADPEGMPVIVTLEAIPAGVIQEFATISTDQLAIKFAPNKGYQAQEYNANIILSDGDKSSVYEFRIKVTSTLPTFVITPKFSQSIVKILKVPINSEKEYSLPIEMNCNDLEVVHTLALPAYATFEFPCYKFFPKLVSHLGLVTIQGVLKNSQGEINFQFQVYVDNQPPKLQEQPQNYKVLIGTQISITLGSIIEPENLPIIVQTFEENEQSLPQFISFNKKNGVYSVSPTIRDKIKKYIIVIHLTDSFGAQSKYKFTIEVYNAEIKSEPIKAKYQAKLKNEIASIQILKIQRNAQATLMVSASKGVANITSSLNNETMEFDIVNSGIESNNTKVQFIISEVDFESGIIQVQLKFANPQKISMNADLDQLRVTVIKAITVNFTDDFVYIPIDTVSIRQIPPQIADNFKKAADMFQGGNLQVSNSNFMNIIILFLVQIFWSQLDDLSFMFINPLISMAVPGLVQIILSVLMNFIYFDILLTDFWIPNIFQTTSNTLEIEGGVNVFFDDNGYQSKSLIKNLGSGFVYIFIYLAFVVIYLIITFLNAFFPKLETARLRLKKFLFWNNTLSLFFSQYPSILLASLINLYSIEFGESFYQKLSAGSSLALMGVVPIGLIGSWWIVRKYTNAKMIESEEFKQTYGTSIQEGTRNTIVGNYWRIFVCVRWNVTCCIMVYLREHPQFQVVTLLAASVLTQMILIYSPPFSNSTDNHMTIFNEIATSAYLYLLLLLTDYHEQSHLRTHFSTSLAALVCLTLGLNSFRAFQRIFSHLKSAYRYLQSKYNSRNSKPVVAVKPTVNDVVEVTKRQELSFTSAGDYFYHNESRQSMFKVPPSAHEMVFKQQDRSIEEAGGGIIVEEEKEEDRVSKQESIGRKQAVVAQKRSWYTRQIHY